MYGYTATNSWGVRVVFLVAAVIISFGALVLRGYRLGDSLAETQANLGLKH